jgi:hypothetical protein
MILNMYCIASVNAVLSLNVYSPYHYDSKDTSFSISSVDCKGTQYTPRHSETFALPLLCS